eukprot:g8809.t1
MEGDLFDEKGDRSSFNARTCVELISLAKMSGVADDSTVKLKRAKDGRSSLSSTKQLPQEPLREAALRVFLLNEQSCPASSRWLESTKPLSLTSVQLCEQCRETMPFDVRVCGDTPRSVWEPRGPSSIAESSEVSLATTATRRVPTVKVASLTSDTPHPAELLGSLGCAGAFPWLSEVTFGGRFRLSVRGVTWPNQVRALTFKISFAHDVAEVAWPSGLERLALEGDFNQAVVGVSWPAGLKAVTFGKQFDQPIDSVVWPEGLGELTFGHAFNQAIDHVGQGALGLKRLTLGWQFDQSLDGVALPEHLEVLSIVGVYNRSIDRLLLPPRLKALTLGGHFNKPLNSTQLPRRLEFLSLGWAFNHPLIGIDWPAGLRELVLGYRFNQPANGVAFPPNMEKLELGVFSRQSLKGLAWPASFKWLTVGRAFDTTGGTLPDGARVCRRGCLELPPDTVANKPNLFPGPR